MWVDTHCHLADPAFDGDRPAVLERAREAGVEALVVVGSQSEEGEKILSLLRETAWGAETPRLFATLGIHPHQASEADEDDLGRLLALAAAHPQVVALGETGLDFHYQHSPVPRQEELFRQHLEGAERLGLPVVVHSREADATLAAILREWGGKVRGVLHCFTGGEDLLTTALRVGWMVSFTGILTFRGYSQGDLLRRIPRDRLMVETDAPYLAPAPYRGKRNEPAWVVHVAEALARWRGEALEEVREYTSRNAARFFGWGA